MIQRHRTQVGHADGVDGLAVMHRVDGDDVGVLQASQFPGLIVECQRDLQRDKPVRQFHLPGTKDLGERPFPKLLHEFKSKHVIAATGHLLINFNQLLRGPRR